MHRKSSPISLKMLVPLQMNYLFSMVPTQPTLVWFNSCLKFQGGNENLSRQRNKHRHVFVYSSFMTISAEVGYRNQLYRAEFSRKPAHWFSSAVTSLILCNCVSSLRGSNHGCCPVLFLSVT